jgi:pyruvate dehydrogenase E2 component (dihydrolipoamide acetyltransferase)/2-oxoglutarate dehydrogenase E2 component (dihydrolipoamide succinyltransferase)
MAVSIAIPKLGWGTEPLKLVEWKAREGNWIEQGDIVLVITTEKITSDVEAEASGYLHILVEEGNEAPIGSAVGLIVKTKEELETIQREPAGEITPTIAESKETPPAEATPVQAATPTVAKTREGKRIRISPVARKMAEEHMIDIASIAGTGPGGRIVREDIGKAIEAGKKVEVTPVVYQGKRVKSTIPLKGMREAIAEHMHRSLSISAQLTSMGEIDMTEVVKLRETLVSQAEAIGARITYTDIFVLAITKLLKDNPIINSSLIDNEIKLWENINIGVAVALEEGLIVPVVKDADKQSLVEISQTIRTLGEKAREGKLVPDNVTGGTFTITNLGALGGGYRFETAIINQPESAILGTGGIVDRAVVRDGQIVIRPIMTYYLTYDHRVINGAEAAKFMANMTRLMENPKSFVSLEGS